MKTKKQEAAVSKFIWEFALILCAFILAAYAAIFLLFYLAFFHFKTPIN
jgi:hypothetical protein